MKLRSAVLVAGFAATFFSCEKDGITGSGTVKTEERDLTAFNKIVVEGSTDIHIVKGTDFEVSVKAYTNLLPYLKTRVENGVLIVKYENSTNVHNDNSEVFITMPALSGLNSSGSGNIDVKGIFEDIQTLEANISGSSDITVENASAEKLKLTISGSGDFRSFGLHTEEADVSITGSGDVEITVNEKLIAKIRGSGNIY